MRGDWKGPGREAFVAGAADTGGASVVCTEGVSVVAGAADELDGTLDELDGGIVHIDEPLEMRALGAHSVYK